MKKLRLNKLTNDEIDTDINEKFNFDFIQWHKDDFKKELCAYLESKDRLTWENQ